MSSWRHYKIRLIQSHYSASLCMLLYFGEFSISLLQLTNSPNSYSNSRCLSTTTSSHSSTPSRSRRILAMFWCNNYGKLANKEGFVTFEIHARCYVTWGELNVTSPCWGATWCKQIAKCSNVTKKVRHHSCSRSMWLARCRAQQLAGKVKFTTSHC